MANSFPASGLAYADQFSVGTASAAASSLYVVSSCVQAVRIEHGYNQTNLHHNTLWLRATNSGANLAASIGFTVVNNGGDHHRANIAATGNANQIGGNLALYTRNNNGNDNLGIYIDHAGNTGIGTTSPSGRLHVRSCGITAGTGSISWPAYNIEDSTTSRPVYIDTEGNGNVGTAGYGATVSLILGQYYDSRVVITPPGAGSAVPADQGTGYGRDLMVKGGYSDNTNGRFGGRLWLNGGMGYNGAFNTNVGHIIMQGAGGGGNVGIGTTTPGAKLDICGADGRIQSRVDSSDGSTINVRPNAGKCGWISYTEDAVADRWGIGIKNGDAKLYFSSGNVASGGGTTRMVLDGCNLGINTTSTSAKLSVEGSATDVESVARFNNQVNCTTRVWLRNSNHSAYWGLSSTSTADPLATGMCPGAMTLGFGNNFPIQFWNGSPTSVKMTIASDGNVGIGTGGPSYKLHVNGTFYAAGSSIKYKHSICDYDTDSCIFMCLKPVTYQYKDEWQHLGREMKSQSQIGLIAEDVAQVMPELAILVNEEEEKVVRNVDYEKLSVVLLKEVQKLRREMDDLKHKEQ